MVEVSAMNIRLIIFDFDGTLGDTRHNIVLTMQHMNKRLWNDVYFNRDVPDDVIRQLVRNSYDLILAKLTKRERDMLNDTPSD